MVGRCQPLRLTCLPRATLRAPGGVSWVMVAYVGIDGVKMLSNLGGLPGMLIVLLSSSALIIWMKNPSLLTPPLPADELGESHSPRGPTP